MENIQDNINSLIEKYNFDYIYINPKDIDNINFEFIAEEVFSDIRVKPQWLGLLKDSKIEVYWDKKITPGDVIFKYKSIKKERKIKLFNIFHNSLH